jgi:hypothetical protein
VKLKAKSKEQLERRSKVPKHDESTAVERLSDMAGPVEVANAEEEFYAIAQSPERVTGLGSSGNVVDKECLVGVPMVVRKVTYNSGRGTLPGTEVRKDMVTLEAIIAPLAVMENLGINPAKLESADPRRDIRPSKIVIFNDSGTGIYRQATAQLHAEEKIEVDAEKGALTTRGKSGETAFDQPRSEWVNEGDASTGILVKWVLEKGLNQSKPYEAPDGSIAHTYYFA